MELLQKNVKLASLFNSKIFYHDFEFDERDWPATHSNTDKQLQPYNKSMFNLRNEYVSIFESIYKQDIEKEVKL